MCVCVCVCVVFVFRCDINWPQNCLLYSKLLFDADFTCHIMCMKHETSCWQRVL